MTSKNANIQKQKPIPTGSGKMVTNAIFINIYNALDRMPQAVLTLNVGTRKQEQNVARGWRGDQLVIFHRNKMKLKSHFDELALQEANVEKLKKQSATKALKAISSKNNDYSNEIDNLTAVVNEWNDKRLELTELPVLDKLPFSDIADLEISNTPFMGIVMEYLIDLDK